MPLERLALALELDQDTLKPVIDRLADFYS